MKFFFKFTDKDAYSGNKDAQNLLWPKRRSKLSSGFDLSAANKKEINLHKNCIHLIPTGIALALSTGYEAQIRSRSGLSLKHGIAVLNSPGTIDADYRGEIKIILINHGNFNFCIKRGIKIAQLIIAPVIMNKLVLKTTLNKTLRGTLGFGSSDNFLL
jgi:dUTP pyrophosphatase